MDQSIKSKIKSLPQTPGVYIFKDKTGKILYVGKAASLKNRVRSYFFGANNYSRPIEFAIDQVEKIQIKRADTVLEAYLLEQELIGQLQPKYNIMGKDDKSFVFVCVTKDEFPTFMVKRKTDLENEDIKIYSRIYGPYTARHQVETALKIMRKIFPYHSKKQKTEKGCLDFQIGLCPGPYAEQITSQEYRKNIRGIEMMFKGKKKTLLRRLEKEMKDFSRRHDFEKAAERRNQLFALEHIQDVAMITRNEKSQISDPEFRIEGYDISNISGMYAVGSMVVFDNSAGKIEPNKREYRKFKIKTVTGPDDVGAMEEVLSRRFRNNWPLPNMILLDGGEGQLNAVEKVLNSFVLDIPIVAVAKGADRKKLDLRFTNLDSRKSKLKEIIENKNLLAQIRDEAHRFAISYHKKLRGRGLIGK